MIFFSYRLIDRNQIIIENIAKKHFSQKRELLCSSFIIVLDMVITLNYRYIIYVCLLLSAVKKKCVLGVVSEIKASWLHRLTHNED